MAEGRLLKKSIANDGRLAQLSPDSQHLFVRAIPFQDNEGRMPGDPGAVRELVVPLLPWSNDTVDQLIAEWASTVHEEFGVPSPLVVRYPLDPPTLWRDREAGKEYECRLALQFAGFKNQPGRLRRGAPSTLPAPPGDVGQWATGPVGHNASGPPPAQPIRARAPGLGSSPRESSLLERSTSSSLEMNQAKRIDQAAWLDEIFVEVFGRPPRASQRDQILELVELADRVGGAEVRRLMVERRGRNPQALAYFLQPLRDLATSAKSTVLRGQRTAPCEECGVGGGLHLLGCARSSCDVAPSEIVSLMPGLRSVDAA